MWAPLQAVVSVVEVLGGETIIYGNLNVAKRKINVILDLLNLVKKNTLTIGKTKYEKHKDFKVVLSCENENELIVKYLKDTIKKYAKYLNLDEDEIIDKFNDFIFSFTSRIPINDILEQTREINILESKSEENKVVSPYTIKRKKKSYRNCKCEE